MTRVPAGAYRTAAIALTREHGEFDKYTLARRVRLATGNDDYPMQRQAAAWIRSEARGFVKVKAGQWRGGMVHRVKAPICGPIRSGGMPASYVITAIGLLED